MEAWRLLGFISKVVLPICLALLGITSLVNSQRLNSSQSLNINVSTLTNRISPVATTTSGQKRTSLPEIDLQKYISPSSSMSEMLGTKPISEDTTMSNSQSHRQKADHLARSILQNLLLKVEKLHGPTDSVSSSATENEISYHDGETIATIQTNSNGSIKRCSLFEIKRPEDSQRILAEYAKEKRIVRPITFRTMLTVITACQDIEPLNSSPEFLPSIRHNLQPPNSGSNLIGTERPQSPIQLDVGSMRTIISGILPGTKWCGLGDIAEDYEDLGAEMLLDKCCRAHDHCPTKLRSFRRRFGLINWSLYTKSHCDCDSLLYDCLKNAHNAQAELLGNFYFNVLQAQCIEDVYPVNCVQRDAGNGQCLIWEPDQKSLRKMMFRNVRKQF